MPSDSLAQEADVLNALIEIRGRQAELQACCERAETNKANVSPAVFTRVMADYRGRLKALDEEAMPLRLQARDAHAVLCASYADVRRANEQAASEREELLFRHTVGEFDQDVLDARIKEPEHRLAACADALAALDVRRERFLEAFGGEAALDAFMGKPQAPAPVATVVAPPPEPELVATPPPPPDVEVWFPAPVEAEPAAPEPVAPEPLLAVHEHEPVTREILQPEPLAPDAAEDRTRMVSIDAAGYPVETLPPPVDHSEAGTMILPSAVLVVRLKGEPEREYAVSPFTTIGRSDHNSVCIPRRNVSREHAIIQATADGFMIKDKGSQNGTLVNGDTIRECLLHDGDQVVIGDAQIDFRLLVPPRA